MKNIYNTRALIEVSRQGVGSSPEPSFGTHFFQDLMEAHIFPLAVFLDDKNAVFNRDFFYDSPNRLADWLPSANSALEKCLRLVAAQDFRASYHLNLMLDDDKNRAVEYLESERP